MTFADSYREYLGGATLAAAATSMTVTIAPRLFLWIEIAVAGFNVADIPALQFNGDTGGNYSSRYVSFAASTVTATNVATTTTTMARLGANTSTKSQAYYVAIANSQTLSKSGAVTLYVGSGAVATTVALVFGGFEWNAAAPITSVKLLSVSGNSFSAASMMRITGRDI